jgi:hypothetical protein
LTNTALAAAIEPSTSSVPPFTVIAPRKVLFPVSVSVPVPTLVNVSKVLVLVITPETMVERLLVPTVR